VIVTEAPPDGSPERGLTAVTVGTVVKLNWSAELVALVPSGVVTVMSTVPAEPGGAMAVIEVAEP